MMKAALVISHGSRSAKTKEELGNLIKGLRERSNIPVWGFGFLELESPSIPEGIDHCVDKGADEIVVLLNFLNSGKHVDEDIPRIIEESRKKYPQVTIKLSSPIGQHQNIVELFLDYAAHL